MDIIDKYYTFTRASFNKLVKNLVPHIRMLIRFIALPYAYFILVNWDECKASRWQVFKDFLYIFFILRDFPDYYTVLRLWEKDREEWKYYYGSNYNPYQRAALQKHLQPSEYEILFADKYVSHQLCISGNIPVPEFQAYITPEDNYQQIIKGILESINDKVIIKDARGRGGQGIYLAFKDGEKFTVIKNNEFFALDQLTISCPSIIQRYIKQHPDLEKFCSSVNTIRTETIITKNNEVVVLGSFIRFGIKDYFLDNQKLGGLSVGVNIETGEIYDTAMNGAGEVFTEHPDSGVPFKGFVIPYWDEVLKLSEQVQRNFSYYNMLGPDIAITPEGPVVIEINATPDHAGLEMDYGPVLKNKKVWQVFKDYDLLINKPSKNAWK